MLCRKSSSGGERQVRGETREEKAKGPEEKGISSVQHSWRSYWKDAEREETFTENKLRRPEAVARRLFVSHSANKRSEEAGDAILRNFDASSHEQRVKIPLEVFLPILQLLIVFSVIPRRIQPKIEPRVKQEPKTQQKIVKEEQAAVSQTESAGMHLKMNSSGVLLKFCCILQRKIMKRRMRMKLRRVRTRNSPWAFWICWMSSNNDMTTNHFAINVSTL